MAKRNKGVGAYTTDKSPLTRVNPPGYDSDNHNQSRDIYKGVTENAEANGGYPAPIKSE